MSVRTTGVLLAVAGLAVVVLAHPPQPFPYVFDSVSMAIVLPLAATTLSVAGGLVVALDGRATGDRPGHAAAVAPLWGVSPVAAYLVGVAGFGIASPLVLFSLALGSAASVVVTARRRR